MIETLKTWFYEYVTLGFAFGVMALAFVLFMVWAIYDLFTQPDEKL